MRTDSAGRVYARARVVEPPKARFMTEDPIWFPVSGHNLYVYSNNAPSTRADPTGLDPSVEPGCLEKDVMNFAIKTACQLLASSPCLSKLSPARRGCMSRWCSRNLVIKCGSRACGISERSTGKLCAYTSNPGCNITLCSRAMQQGKCALPGETTGGSLVRIIIHEASHCCSFDDYQHGGWNTLVHVVPCYGSFSDPVGTNPADDLAQCVTGAAGLNKPLPGYWGY
jgi:RHS repeat-associated protein